MLKKDVRKMKRHDLQVWNELGADAFTFKPLEYLGKDDMAFPADRLKALRANWIEQLAARPV